MAEQDDGDKTEEPSEKLRESKKRAVRQVTRVCSSVCLAVGYAGFLTLSPSWGNAPVVLYQCVPMDRCSGSRFSVCHLANVRQCHAAFVGYYGRSLCLVLVCGCRSKHGPSSFHYSQRGVEV